MKNRLFNKEILLICPKYFDYHAEMISALEKMGAKVDYFDERPSNTAISKMLIRLNKGLIDSKIREYYSNILNTIRKNKYDYVLIVKPESIPKDVILQLKKLNPNAKIILALWDSIANNPAAEEKITLVHKAFSFDRNDCEKYNMNFRPLFYSEKYNDIATKPSETHYDLLFIGTVHSDRYKVLKNLEEKLNKSGYKVFYYMYIPNKLLYYIKKFILGELPGASIKEFKFKSVNQDEVLSLVSKSKVIIDIQHPKQTGLTMRTLEILGANKKIITTNSHVKEYDFYNESNICIAHRDMEDLDMKFFKSEYIPVENSIKEKYSIEAWLMELLY